MASIEVSLSTTNGTPGPISNPPSVRLNKRNKANITSATALLRANPEKIVKEIDSLKNMVRDKENVIRSLKSQLNVPYSSSRISSRIILTDADRKNLEERDKKLEKETDNKKVALKNLKYALEKLDVSDNIDVRIQQAELEYQLEREELNLLNLEEEARSIKERLKESAELKKKTEGNAIFSTVPSNMNVTIHAVKVSFDPSNPCFTVSTKDDKPGLYVTWFKDDLDLKKGDRLIEINGRLCLLSTLEDLSRLLCDVNTSESDDDPNKTTLRLLLVRCQPQLPQRKELSALRSELQLVTSRYEAERSRNEEAKHIIEKMLKDKDSAKGENLRLTHRIGYLEDQVYELQHSLESALTNCSSVSKMVANDEELLSTIRAKNRYHRQTLASAAVFQKGSHKTTVPAEVTMAEPVMYVKSPESSRRHHQHVNGNGTIRYHQPQSHLRARLLETLRRVSPPNCDTRSVDSLPSVTMSESGHHHHKHKGKPPPPPKKPSRLSLQRATSVQSVDGTTTSDSQRSATKRSHKAQSSLKPWPSMEHTATPPQQKTHRGWAALSPFRSGSSLGLSTLNNKNGEKWC